MLHRTVVVSQVRLGAAQEVRRGRSPMVGRPSDSGDMLVRFQPTAQSRSPQKDATARTWSRMRAGPSVGRKSGTFHDKGKPLGRSFRSQRERGEFDSRLLHNTGGALGRRDALQATRGWVRFPHCPLKICHHRQMVRRHFGKVEIRVRFPLVALQLSRPVRRIWCLRYERGLERFDSSTGHNRSRVRIATLPSEGEWEGSTPSESTRRDLGRAQKACRLSFPSAVGTLGA